MMQTQQLHPRRDCVKMHRWVRLSFIQSGLFSVRHCDLYPLLLILVFLHAVRSEQKWIILLIQLFLKCMEESQLLPHQFNSHLYGSRKLVPREWRKGYLLEEPTVGCEGCCKHSINLRNLFNTVSSWHSDWMDFPPLISDTNASEVDETSLDTKKEIGILSKFLIASRK